MADPQDDPRWRLLQHLAGQQPIQIPSEVPEYDATPPAPRSWGQRTIDPIESHKLPVHAIPGQDPWSAGVAHRVTQQPGALEGTYQYLAGDPGNYLLPPAGIAVNAQTVGLFEKAMQDAVDRIAAGGEPVTGSQLTDVAQAWAKLRWPRYASQVPTTSTDLLGKKTLGALLPAPTPEGYQVLISPREVLDYVDRKDSLRDLYRIPSPGIPRGRLAVGDAIDTLMHEQTHYRQTQRGARLPARAEQPGVHSDLGRLFGWDAVNAEAQLKVPYKEREIEKGARRGGRTAGKSYLKFLQELYKKYGLTEPAGPASGEIDPR